MAHVSLAECLLHAQSLTDSGCVQQAVAFLQGHRKRFAMCANGVRRRGSSGVSFGLFSGLGSLDDSGIVFPS